MKLPFISKYAFFQWIFLFVVIILFTCSLILINFIAYKHNKRFDLTPEKQFTLSSQTLRILNSLKYELKATIFYKKGDRRTFEDLLELFSRACPSFHYRFIDLDKNPAIAENFGIRNYGAGFVEYQGKRETISYLTEENLVSAILFLTEKKKKFVRFLRGHGEKDISSTDKTGLSDMKMALESENYSVQDLLLVQSKKVPDDTLVLIVAGPEKDFFPKELDMIDEYLKNGGKVMVLCDPFPLPQLEEFLKKFHIVLSRDFVIDRQSRLFDLDELVPIIYPVKGHVITDNFNDVVIFPLCRSVVPEREMSQTVEVKVLAQSGPNSWAEHNKKSVYEKKARFDKGSDVKGPIPVALMVRVLSLSAGAQQDKGNGFLMVTGDADFITNHYLSVMGNKDFFLNTIGYLAEERELIATRPPAKQSPISMLFLTENENRLVLWSAVIIEPAFVLLAGIIVVLWRRFRG